MFHSSMISSSLFKYILSLIAILMTLYAFFPYIGKIRKGEVKPHIFSWIIWGITTFLVFFAQIVSQGGPGAWPIGVSGSITIYVALLAYRKHSDHSISLMDWFFLIGALAAIPIWFFTSDPLWAVVCLTTIDVLGFGPTIRRSYEFPYEENIGFFALFTVRNFVSILALDKLSLTTVLFPATIIFFCLLLIALIASRRLIVSQNK
ncbi:hypothetical protein [Leptospira idonii]|nr:hypothetical protein [Leptospira idonii]